MNPVLQQIIDGIEQHVKPEDKESYSKVVIAGLKIMFDPKSHQNMELVKNPNARKQPVQTIASGVSGLMYLMYMQSNRTLTIPVMGASATSLMCHVIDFAERSLNIPFSNEMIAQTTKLLVTHLFERMGVSHEQLQAAIDKSAEQQPEPA